MGQRREQGSGSAGLSNLKIHGAINAMRLLFARIIGELRYTVCIQVEASPVMAIDRRMECLASGNGISTAQPVTSARSSELT